MLEQWVVGIGAAAGVCLALRWYIGVQVEREIERRWQTGLSRHAAELERLKQRQALAQIAAKQAEERAARGDGNG